MSSPSTPTSPDPSATAKDGGTAESTQGDRASTDGVPKEDKAADVDALISELRASLASSQTLLSTQATRLSTLADLEVTHQQLKDQHAFLTAAKGAVETQLREEVRRREAAEEKVDALQGQVETLRGQVETARRGVMSLQKAEKDRKRASMLVAPGAGAGGGGGAPTGLGLSNSGVSLEPEEMLDPPAAARDRSSFMSGINMGLGGGRGHRRVSSNSEPDYLAPTPVVGGSALSTSPNIGAGPLPPTGRTGLRELRLGGSSGAGAGAGTTPTITSPSTMSAFEDPYAPSQRTSISPPPALSSSPSRAITAAKAEAERLRTELAATQLRLAESEEARQASETVLKALREFIGAGAGAGAASSSSAAGGGNVVDLNDPSMLEELRGISLPPLPTDRDPDEPAQPTKPAPAVPAGGGWGFKLWQSKPQSSGGAAGGPTSPSSQIVEPPFTPSQNLSPPPSVRSLSFTPGARQSAASTSADGQLLEGAIGAVPGGTTPLASFVSNWTKTVSPGAPSTPGTGPAGSADQQPPTTRSFSSFFGRRKSNASASAPTSALARDKDLPIEPAARHQGQGTGKGKDEEEEAESDVGSVGAEKTADAPEVGAGLEPSPEIVEPAVEEGTADVEEQALSQVQGGEQKV